VHENSTSVT